MRFGGGGGGGGGVESRVVQGAFTSLSQGGSRYNISLSRGAFIYCPGWGWGVCLQILPSVGVSS